MRSSCSSKSQTDRSNDNRTTTSSDGIADIIEERGIVNGESVVLNRYAKGKFLGKGGFARCYVATDLKTRKTYALKIVPKSLLSKPKAREKFDNEIRIHRSVRNRHVVGFENYFEDSDNAYILLELCHNNSMSELLKRRTRLTEMETRYYMLQLLDAFKYLHANGIIHRDLKLGNLFIDSNMHIKVGDFGLATRVSSTEERKSTICGTPNYIAPEILDSKLWQGHSFQVDIWSMGVVLYTCIVGRPPYEAKDVKSTYKRILSNTYSFPPDVHVSQACHSLVSSMLQTHPDGRPDLDTIMSSPFFCTDFCTVPISLPKIAMHNAPSESCIQFTRDKEQMLSSGPSRTTNEDFARTVPDVAFSSAGNENCRPAKDFDNVASDGHGFQKKQTDGTGDNMMRCTVSSSTGSRLRQPFRELQLDASSRNPTQPGQNSYRGSSMEVENESDFEILEDGKASESQPSVSSSTRTSAPSSSRYQSILTQAKSPTRRAASSMATAASSTSTAASMLSRGPTRQFSSQRPPIRTREMSAMISKVSNVVERTSSHMEDAWIEPQSTVTTNYENNQNCVKLADVRKQIQPTMDVEVHAENVTTTPTTQVDNQRFIQKDIGTLEGIHDNLNKGFMPGFAEDMPNRQMPVEELEGFASKQENHGEVVRQLFHDSRSFDGEENQFPPAPSKVWVVKYVDYTSKYGLGFLMNNGCVGVHFNDSTKIVAQPQSLGDGFQYVERRRDDKGNKINEHISMTYSINNFPQELTKKVTLLKHFRDHLLDAASQENIPTGQDSDNDEMPHTSPPSLIFVKKWVRTRHAILFRLSNSSVQVMFSDQSEVILSSEAKVITYVDKDKFERRITTVEAISIREDPEVSKRLKYTKDLLHELIYGHGSAQEQRDQNFNVDSQSSRPKLAQTAQVSKPPTRRSERLVKKDAVVDDNAPVRKLGSSMPSRSMSNGRGVASRYSQR